MVALNARDSYIYIRRGETKHKGGYYKSPAADSQASFALVGAVHWWVFLVNADALVMKPLLAAIALDHGPVWVVGDLTHLRSNSRASQQKAKRERERERENVRSTPGRCRERRTRYEGCNGSASSSPPLL